MVALLLSACTAEDSIVELGIIEFYQDQPMIEAPASAAVGQPVLVTVNTYGSGCTSLERTEIELTDDGALVMPFDRERIPGENEGCPLPLLSFPHEATLSFPTAGPKLIRIRGRRIAPRIDDQIELPLTVLVE